MAITIQKIKTRVKNVLQHKSPIEPRRDKENWCWGYVIAMFESGVITEDELNKLYKFIDKN